MHLPIYYKTNLISFINCCLPSSKKKEHKTSLPFKKFTTKKGREERGKGKKHWQGQKGLERNCPQLNQ